MAVRGLKCLDGLPHRRAELSEQSANRGGAVRPLESTQTVEQIDVDGIEGEGDSGEGSGMCDHVPIV